MPGHDIIVIGASAGGVEALSQLVKQISPKLSATLFVVLHFPSYGVSVLPEILNRCRSLPAAHPQLQEQIQPGRIYIAPPDYHLVIHPHYVRLDQGPKENGHRPAIDTLFRSAAYAYGNRVVGIVLSGMLDDGTAGLAVIKSQGGLAIAQDPEEALFGSMPCSAINNGAIDHVFSLTDIATYLNHLTHTPIQVVEPMTEAKKLDADIVAQDKASLERGERSGNPSPLTCPDCGGVLWELQDNGLLRFRCHTGHAYSVSSLAAGQADEVEKAIWSAVRALEEKASLARRMANHALENQRGKSAAQFQERALEAAQHAALLRQVILEQNLTLLSKVGEQ